MPWGELPVCRLFHGAVEVVRSPDVTKGVPRKDYGRGFYTTSFGVFEEAYDVNR
jgi:hypothetical protein